MKRLFACVFLSISVTANAFGQDWEYLIDENLSKWEVWMGVPHSDIEDLPPGTHTSDSVFTDIMGRGMGLSNDPKNVFSIIQKKGEMILKITGEIYGGLTTRKEYKNYHLSLRVKWGNKKWPPRSKLPKDTGLLFHCQGDHGVLLFVWKSCLEFQIMENHFGDFLPLAGTSGKVKSKVVNYGGRDYFQYSASGSTFSKDTDHVMASANTEKPQGEWNHLELYSVGDRALFVINGVIAMVVEKTKNKYGAELSSGQLQIQSEGAEVFYKDIKIRSIERFPEMLARGSKN